MHKTDEDRFSAASSLAANARKRVRRLSLPLSSSMRPEIRRPSLAHHALPEEMPPPSSLPHFAAHQPAHQLDAVGLAALQGGPDGADAMGAGGAAMLRRHRRKLSAPSPRLYKVPEIRDDLGHGDEDRVGDGGSEFMGRVIRVRRYHSLQVPSFYLLFFFMKGRAE